jgi:hypothetical protein
MNAMALFLTAFALIGVLPILLRSKGANVFMMLCVGRAVMEVSASEIGAAARIVLNSNLPVDNIARMFIMLLPAVLTILITRKAAKKKLPYHIIPSLVAGVLAGFWSAKLFGPGEFGQSPTYSYVNTNVSIIIGIGIFTTLLLFIVERPKPAKNDDTEAHSKH